MLTLMKPVPLARASSHTVYRRSGLTSVHTFRECPRSTNVEASRFHDELRLSLRECSSAHLRSVDWDTSAYSRVSDVMPLGIDGDIFNYSKRA